MVAAKIELETLISYLLIIGVTVSIIIESIGLTALAIRQGNFQIELSEPTRLRSTDFFRYVYEVTGSVFRASSSAAGLMALGIAVLLLTPFIRVIASAAYFAKEKDAKYVAFTIFVLTVLTLSLTAH